MARGISSNAATAHSLSIPPVAIPMTRTASRQKATELPAIASVSEPKMQTDAVTREAVALKIPPPPLGRPCAQSRIQIVTKAMASMKVQQIRRLLVTTTSQAQFTDWMERRYESIVKKVEDTRPSNEAPQKLLMT